MLIYRGLSVRLAFVCTKAFTISNMSHGTIIPAFNLQFPAVAVTLPLFLKSEKRHTKNKDFQRLTNN